MVWLDPGMRDARVVSDMLKPYDARMMQCYPVSSRINSVANDDAECSMPTEIIPVQRQTTLF
jgi:putative SOS response-associated peptidase YedK